MTAQHGDDTRVATGAVQHGAADRGVVQRLVGGDQDPPPAGGGERPLQPRELRRIDDAPRAAGTTDGVQDDQADLAADVDRVVQAARVPRRGPAAREARGGAQACDGLRRAQQAPLWVRSDAAGGRFGCVRDRLVDQPRSVALAHTAVDRLARREQRARVASGQRPIALRRDLIGLVFQFFHLAVSARSERPSTRRPATSMCPASARSRAPRGAAASTSPSPRAPRRRPARRARRRDRPRRERVAPSARHRSASPALARRRRTPITR